MSSSLTGSAPKASFSTQPTILPQQQGLLQLLSDLLTSGQQPAGVQSYNGTFAAPLAPIQNTSLAALEQDALGGPPQSVSKNPQSTNTLNQGFNALTSALGYKPPQIDSTEAFNKGVVDPLTTNFEQRVLPALDARFAGSAGGAFGSGRQEGNRFAAQDLNNTLAQQGSTFAYNTAAANQQADLTANQQRLTALGEVPQLATVPTALDTSVATTNEGLDTSWVSRLMQVLSGGSVPYNVAQTQVTGQYQDYLNQVQQGQSLMALIASAFGAPTVNTVGVGTGGSSGILGPLLGGVGSVASAFIKSDERLKEDLEPIGDVDGIPLYRFRYKGEPTRHIGFIAQDVERRVPDAVRTDASGYKAVNYNRVIESVLEAA
jgi:hypothetical protein